MSEVAPTRLRSRIMSRVRAKNTQIELEIRRRLFVRGFRYRIHRKDLPGTPDIVFPKYRTAIFVHGCFWHYHRCHLSVVPQTRRSWWLTKLTRTATRDSVAIGEIAEPRLASTDHLGVRLSQTSHNPFRRLGFYFGKGGEIPQFYRGIPGNS